MYHSTEAIAAATVALAIIVPILIVCVKTCLQQQNSKCCLQHCDFNYFFSEEKIVIARNWMIVAHTHTKHFTRSHFPTIYEPHSSNRLEEEENSNSKDCERTFGVAVVGRT